MNNQQQDPFSSLLDFAVGAIPLVGDAFDFMFKSNLKNLRLLREEKT